MSSLGVMPWEGRLQGAPLPDSGSLTWVCPNSMQLACAVGVKPKVLGSRCLNQDLQDFWVFSGMLAMGRFLFGGYVFD